MDAREYRRRVPRPSPRFSGEKPRRMRQEGWPANGRKPSRELTCVACRLVDVREGTRVSNEGRLEACRLARCRQPRARGAQRSGGGDVKSKTKIPRELDRVASGVQSTVVFLCLQKPKTEIHRTVLSQSIIRPINLEIPRGHERLHCRQHNSRASPHTHQRYYISPKLRSTHGLYAPPGLSKP